MQIMRFTIIIVTLLASLPLRAQKLNVESMTIMPMDLSASLHRKTDLNGEICGLIKVQLALNNAEFEGNIIGEPVHKTGEYWIYLSPGSYMLRIKHQDFVPLDIDFREYGISCIQGKETYKLTLLMPQVTSVSVGDGSRYFKLTVSPTNSKVTIDGRSQLVDENGFVSLSLQPGSHRYTVEAEGYSSISDEVIITDKTVEKQVILESSLVPVSVRCPTAGAVIYVDDKKMGQSPWNGNLTIGTHTLEARLPGYSSQLISQSISKSIKKKITIPALQPVSGNLHVNYEPIMAEVWVDGKLIGTAPKIFSNLPTGQHHIEIRKKGFVTKQEIVTIAEGKVVTLSGKLEQENAINQKSSASVTGNNAIETFTVNNVSFNMVHVEGGILKMGKKVAVSDFSIGESEVTQELWTAVMRYNPSKFKNVNLPVEMVSWFGCQEFIRKLNELTGRQFRLPTEAEWEYAARGGNKSRGYKYAGSNNINDVAWYSNTTNDKGTRDVKTKQANELGLYDMSGNVWEWCQDLGGRDKNCVVIRGGSWYCNADYCSVFHRAFVVPDIPTTDIGLRLILDGSSIKNTATTIEKGEISSQEGSLIVMYRPLQCEVWLDGKQIGCSPSTFHNIQIGLHDVEIRKAGYVTKQEKVTIAKNQTTALTGELEQIQE